MSQSSARKVYCAMLMILLAAVAVTVLKIYLVEKLGPTEDPNPTFKPRPQVTGSNIMYTGNGFLPCNGFVPCQPDSLPPWKNAARLEGGVGRSPGGLQTSCPQVSC